MNMGYDIYSALPEIELTTCFTRPQCPTNARVPLITKQCKLVPAGNWLAESAELM